MRKWALAGLMGMVWAPAAFSADNSVQLGFTHQATVGGAATGWLQHRWDPRPLSARVSLEPVASLGFVQRRDEPGSQEHVWLAGGGARWHWTSKDGVQWPVFLETQVLGAHGRTDALSGPIQFGTAVGWSGERVEVMVRHLSNAGLKGPNRGENQLLVGWKF
jgi:hypothetical protein